MHALRSLACTARVAWQNPEQFCTAKTNVCRKDSFLKSSTSNPPKRDDKWTVLFVSPILDR
jgi:hypothetical protein